MVKDIISGLFDLVGTFNTQTWFILIAVFLGISVVTAIAKGIQKAILVLLVTGVLMTCGVTSSTISSIVGIKTDGNFIYVNNDAVRGLKVDVTSIENVEITKNNGKTGLKIKFKDGSYQNLDLDIAEEYYGIVKKAVSSLPVVVSES